MEHGVIVINKEKGFTSHDVVAKLRGIIGQKKIGHTGTLDPMATGVLPVCLGNATKLCDFLTDERKEYETLMHMGLVSDTQDITGTILYNSTSRKVDITLSELEEALIHFKGKIEQIPPMYSAKKVNGKKLYELAREGKTIERKAREIEIFDIEIKNFNPPYVRLRIECSKGTYIRTICHDLGMYLKCGAVMEELERTKVGRFIAEEAYTLSEVEELKNEGRIHEAVFRTDFFFLDEPAVHVKTDSMKLLLNGNKLAADDLEENKDPMEMINPNTGERSFCIADLDVTVGTVPDCHTPRDNGDYPQLSHLPRVRVYDKNEVFYGVYEYDKDSRSFKPVQMFFPETE